jgi:hypothetical protein
MKFAALLCLFGRHDWFNDGTIYYTEGHHGTERLVQRCERCWRVRFL